MRGADVTPRESREEADGDSEGGEEDQRAQQMHAGHKGRRIKPERNWSDPPPAAKPGQHPQRLDNGQLAHTPHTRGSGCKRR
eukprot:5426618-Alexandrium_andersonii.AAC.1